MLPAPYLLFLLIHSDIMKIPLINKVLLLKVSCISSSHYNPPCFAKQNPTLLAEFSLLTRRGFSLLNFIWLLVAQPFVLCISSISTPSFFGQYSIFYHNTHMFLYIFTNAINCFYFSIPLFSENKKNSCFIKH